MLVGAERTSDVGRVNRMAPSGYLILFYLFCKYLLECVLRKAAVGHTLELA